VGGKDRSVSALLAFFVQVCLIGDCMGSVLGYDILAPPTRCRPRATPSPPPKTPSPTQIKTSISTNKHRKTSAVLPPSSYATNQLSHRERSNTGNMVRVFSDLGSQEANNANSVCWFCIDSREEKKSAGANSNSPIFPIQGRFFPLSDQIYTSRLENVSQLTVRTKTLRADCVHLVLSIS
jgi:hypothetical protein